MVKDTEYKSDVIDFSPAQILAGKITAIAVTVLLIVWYVLVALNVVPVSFWGVFAGSLVGAIGLILLISGAIQKNSVSVWLAFPFLIPAIIEFLTEFSISQYAQLYPLYVAIPAISSLICLTFAGGKSAHVKVVIFFTVQALCYLFSVLAIIPLYVSVIISSVWALIAVIYILIRIFRSTNEHE
ncbi:MAG: hypothetical protein E7353_06540 [Clostridiales bacterium]|nr:hypothetical protein [Clostridiales bacterium]